MKTISTIGLDIAKRVFQVHGIDREGQVVVQKKLSRAEVVHWFGEQPSCLVGMEACATAHYWAQEIGRLGHRVRLMPPAYVKPYVRRQKNDRTDAAAICEAVSRPSMRFVEVKTKDQQAIQVLHRTRELLIQQVTQAGNALRGHLAEFGWIFPLGNPGLSKAIDTAQDMNIALPEVARQPMLSLIELLKALKREVVNLDRQMAAWHKAQADSQRLATIPGIGVITASAILAAIGGGRQFKSGREFAAWVGLVPRQSSSGGKERLGRISKKGNAYLRRLLVMGATAQLRGARQIGNAPGGPWFGQLIRRKSARVASVALANKMARVAWAVLTKGEVYRCATT